jgi:hypothetical protein
VERPAADLLAGLHDGLAAFVVQVAQLAVGQRRRLFDGHEGVDEFRIQRDGHPRDGEVLEGPEGVDSPVGVGGNRAVAEEIVFESGGMLSGVHGFRIP